jgi:hypothetical protein
MSGSFWAAPPSRPKLDRERKQVVEAGKPKYEPVITFTDTGTKTCWSEALMKANPEALT